MMNPNGAVSGNSQNIPEAHVPRSRSTFPLHYEYPHSDPFGEYRPYLAEDVNKDEVFPIHSSHEIRSYTLKAPLMQNVRRNKDSFFVPSEAILPLNWEKFYDHPVRGDDVLAQVGPTVEGFWNKVALAMSALQTELNSILADNSTTNEKALLATLRFLIIGEYFYSNGNLLSTLNCHGAPYVVLVPLSGNPRYHTPMTWDSLFDDLLSEIVSKVDSFTLSVDGYSYTVRGYSSPSGYGSISWHHALSLMRDNPTFTVSSVTLVAANVLIPAIVYQFSLVGFQYKTANVPCKLEKLWAYQLCCAHYFTNDHIDFVYSAELYRQLIGSYLNSLIGNSWDTVMFFTRNGIKYQYDYLSAFCCYYVLSMIPNSGVPNYLLATQNQYYALTILGYLSALFGFRRSLRYLDYFTGSRSQPLAVVGNTGVTSTDVAVNANKVSVIDITRSIQAQRLLNSVNRVRHSFEGYLKGVFGGKLPAPDYHNPLYLSHTSDVIYGQETENTASNQMQDDIAITTNLRGTSGNYVFEAHTDRPGIVIGISSFDITRIYTRSMDRSFLHVDRYDWFNPFLQWLGDQPVYLQELGIEPTTNALNTLTPWAYTLRHMEYKQKVNFASGAFCEEGYLPGWIFVALDTRGNQSSINPDFIRSVPAEFDRFYISLAGYSLATYFHFIVKDFNSTNASRPMAYSPQILG